MYPKTQPASVPQIRKMPFCQNAPLSGLEMTQAEIVAHQGLSRWRENAAKVATQHVIAVIKLARKLAVIFGNVLLDHPDGCVCSLEKLLALRKSADIDLNWKSAR
jgi:hypothetical protein